MSRLIDNLYTPGKMDSVIPVTKKRFEEAQAMNDLKFAEVMLEIKDLRNATGHSFYKGHETAEEGDHELENNTVTLAKAARAQNIYEEKQYNYEVREHAFETGSIAERTRRFIFGAPLAPTTDSLMPVNVPSQSDMVSETLAQAMNKMSENQAFQNEILSVLVAKVDAADKAADELVNPA